MYSIQSWGDTLRLLVELSATAAFALSGLMKAAGKKLDAVGICVVAFLAAFGGGTLRDLLLDQRPFFWLIYLLQSRNRRSQLFLWRFTNGKQPGGCLAAFIEGCIDIRNTLTYHF